MQNLIYKLTPLMMKAFEEKFIIIINKDIRGKKKQKQTKPFIFAE